MGERARRAATIFGLVAAISPLAAAAGAASLDQLIDRFSAAAPGPVAKAEVEIRGRIEQHAGSSSSREIVITLLPSGQTKLIADPGITVTPEDGGLVRWQTALPLRHVAGDRTYFSPGATIRLPFTTVHSSSKLDEIALKVEYAYCVVDYQCFFDEQRVTVATREP